MNEDFVRNSKTYVRVLEHRKHCPKWGKEFCIHCFGGGLTRFVENLEREKYSLDLHTTESDGKHKHIGKHKGTFTNKQIEKFQNDFLKN